MRFEGKHKEVSNQADVMKSRKNVCYSFALKNQLMFSGRLLEKRSFDNRLKCGPSINIFLKQCQDFNLLK